MRLITLEEHYRSKLVDEAIEPEEDFFRSVNAAGGEFASRMAKLKSLGEDRIADMDAAGIDVQVISHTVPSPELLDAVRAIPLARQVNEEMAEAVNRYPQRLAAFATLPIADPDAAAQELERAVKSFGFKGAMINGVTQGRFL